MKLNIPAVIGTDCIGDSKAFVVSTTSTSWLKKTLHNDLFLKEMHFPHILCLYTNQGNNSQDFGFIYYQNPTLNIFNKC